MMRKGTQATLLGLEPSSLFLYSCLTIAQLTYHELSGDLRWEYLAVVFEVRGFPSAFHQSFV